MTNNPIQLQKHLGGIDYAVDKGVISNLTSGLSADLKTAFGSTGDAALEPALSPKLAPVTQAATALQAQLTRGVHGSADPALAAHSGDAAAAASAALGVTMTPNLDHLLAVRIGGFESARQRVVVVAVDMYKGTAKSTITINVP